MASETTICPTCGQPVLQSKIPLLDLPVDVLARRCSHRLWACIRHDKLQTVRDIVARPAREWLRAPNFGPKTLAELEGILSDHGLGLHA